MYYKNIYGEKKEDRKCLSFNNINLVEFDSSFVKIPLANCLTFFLEDKTEKYFLGAKYKEIKLRLDSSKGLSQCFDDFFLQYAM